MLNAFTVDVEDYFHVSGFAGSVRRKDWNELPSRVVGNTHRLLELLARENVHATFFVLGWVANKYPALVRDIHAAGHEIGNHSYWHRLIYDLTPDEFRSDLLAANRVLEDIIGEPVVAYRAPSFSITSRSLWALDILAEEGFQLDSSIFPVVHHRYGIADAPTRPHTVAVAAGTLHEYPPSIVRIGKFNLPVGGGGYFRLYPAWFTRRCLRAVAHSERPVMFYTHPWELDVHQPRVVAPRMARFRHYVNLSRTEPRLVRLLRTLKFGTMSESLRYFFASETPAHADAITYTIPTTTTLSTVS
jgi:polysaccharide deacetylase family protein (PEP-CTERM system associated)